MRFAAIDLGTVTCRMLVADVRDGRIFPAAKEYSIVNLGEGVDETRLLKPEALLRVKEALTGFLHVRDSLDSPEDPIISTACVATSASRDAENSTELENIFAELGLSVQVITGTREAELTYLGASSAFPGESLMVVDVGGGSTEIVFGAADALQGDAAVSQGDAGGAPGVFSAHGECWAHGKYGAHGKLNAHSYDIGSRRITERFLHSDPPALAELEEARAYIREVLGSTVQSQEILVANDGGNGSRLVAVAGTATSAVSVREKMEIYDSVRVHGASVSSEELCSITQMLADVPLQKREQVIGLDPKRASVIVAGLVILQEVMRLYRKPGFTVSESDILSGIIISEYEKARNAA